MFGTSLWVNLGNMPASGDTFGSLQKDSAAVSRGIGYIAAVYPGGGEFLYRPYPEWHSLHRAGVPGPRCRITPPRRAGRAMPGDHTLRSPPHQGVPNPISGP